MLCFRGYPLIMWKLFSTSWLHACLSLNKQEYHVLLKGTSLPPFTFLPSYFFTQIFEPSVLRGLSFDFEEQSLKTRTKVQGETLMPILNLIMACKCTLVRSPDACFKWSRGPGRGKIISPLKLLGITFPPPWAQTPERATYTTAL